MAVDAEEGRRRREDNMVEIRKNRREESLQKKRREGLQAQAMPASTHTASIEKKVWSSLFHFVFPNFELMRSLNHVLTLYILVGIFFVLILVELRQLNLVFILLCNN